MSSSSFDRVENIVRVFTNIAETHKAQETPLTLLAEWIFAFLNGQLLDFDSADRATIIQRCKESLARVYSSQAASSSQPIGTLIDQIALDVLGPRGVAPLPPSVPPSDNRAPRRARAFQSYPNSSSNSVPQAAAPAQPHPAHSYPLAQPLAPAVAFLPSSSVAEASTSSVPVRSSELPATERHFFQDFQQLLEEAPIRNYRRFAQLGLTSHEYLLSLGLPETEIEVFMNNLVRLYRTAQTILPPSVSSPLPSFPPANNDTDSSDPNDYSDARDESPR